MIAALGKNGQFLNIVPSQNIVLIRMGDNPDNTLVPINFNDDIWAYINNLEHYPSSIAKQKSEKGVLAYPNPTQDVIHIHVKKNMNKATNFILYNSLGLMINKV